MRTRAFLLAPLLALAFAAGCGSSGGGGGGGGGSAPDAASIVPADALVYATVNADTGSDQLDSAQTILDKFPIKQKALASLKTEALKNGVNLDTINVEGFETGIDLFRHGRDYPATNVEASTLAELAKKIGIDPEPFLHTIETFNAACRTDVAFMPGELDGRGTIGITPKKSNWAMPIVKGPFRAYPITGGVTFSFGGIQVDTQARVVNTCNEPIKGLFASGDIIGLFFHNYPSCTGQTRNAVFSHLAGRGAGAMLGRN